MCDNEEYDYFDKSDYCYECQGYGDDYYEDEDGNLICRCFDGCWINQADDDEE